MRSVELVFNARRAVQASHSLGPDVLAALAPFSPVRARLVRRFHAALPAYAPTPLHSLDALAARLGLGRVFVKDESRRFGLKAFKALGASWAVARLLARRLGLPSDSVGPALLSALRTPEARKRVGEMTLVTATDGNHGRGLAWAARLFGLPAVVFMPRGSAEARAEAVRALGARCEITDLSYDDAVRHAAAYARATGGVLTQDTAWAGYEEIPRWIMQGYTSLALESLEQMRALGGRGPTHIFLQAGVGSFAAAVLGFFATEAAEAGHAAPLVVSVEPHNADCVFRSVRAGDGRARPVRGALRTMMAGLACGEVSTLAWKILREGLFAAAACPDGVAAHGMRLLAAPLPGDPALVSGESGAVGAGLLDYLANAPEAVVLRDALGLNGHAVVLLVSTEGDTAPEIHRQVVREGVCPFAFRGQTT
ncbi:diaminopropionate ammonia-lyase [Desulfovibrio sp. SGI.169]|uniref:diaminopropionate ammonia-lyase n=1 Tax=Desulfovibrio sp. SGI.169 TaxID=3420561 RepID=UPI003D062A4F